MAMKVLKHLFRKQTASARALPHFILIGAQKGGTTYLYELLAAHPRMLPAYSKKEIHYFDRHFHRGEDWYRWRFPLRSTLRRRRAVTGETTPSYLFHPRAPRRIAATLPDVRLIVLLRNPVDRAISHYWHMVRMGIEPLQLLEALRQEPERLGGELVKVYNSDNYYSHKYLAFSYSSRGIYVDQIARYLKHFHRSQLLVLRSETFFGDAETVYDVVLRHVGLEPHMLPQLPPSNAGTYPQTPESVREELEVFFQPHNQRLYDLLGLDTPWW